MICKLMACLLVTSTFVGVARAADPAPVRITVIADLNDDLYDARAGRGGVDATPDGGRRFPAAPCWGVRSRSTR